MNASQIRKKLRELDRTAKHCARTRAHELPFLSKMRASYQAQLDEVEPPATRKFTVTAWHERQRRNVGYPPMTGPDALKLMRVLTKRGRYTRALTTAHGITEILTLEEMQTSILTL